MASSNRSLPIYGSDRYRGLARLRDELLQSDLVSPIDVDPKDIQFARRLTVYRLMLMLMLTSVSFVLAEAIVVGGHLALTLIAGIAALLIFATSVRLATRRRILIPPIFTLGLNITVVIMAIGNGADHHALWLFPLMIALAGLLPIPVALVAGIVSLVALVWVRENSANVEDIAEDAALIATWLISLAVMRLMTRQTDELADLALTDPLTGAYNRRYLLPQIQRNIADYQRYARLSTLLMVDIDHFKVINDKYGHAHGDKVLQSIVGLIDQRIRGVDMLFRLGGEEFVVLLSEVGSHNAARIADELRTNISRTDFSPAQQVTVSIGVCDVTQVNSADNWLKQVDEAMYSAKQQGRNRVVAVDTSKVPDPLIASNLPIWR